jgi:hypothetical protein
MDHSDQGPTKGQATLRRAEGEAGPRLLTASWQESQGPRCNSGVVGLPGLEPGDLILISNRGLTAMQPCVFAGGAQP